FAGWMPGVLQSWAPGVRLMNAVYHAAAALVLWRLLLCIGLGRGGALVAAAAFAVHPLAAESVCWISERKNVLAALFGLTAVFCFVRLRPALGVPLAFVAFTLAVFSKVVAIGFGPMLLIFGLCGGYPGLRGEAPVLWRDERAWIRLSLVLAPFAAVAVLSV